MVRARLKSRLKSSRHPAIWSAVAGVCRAARPLSRRRVRWSYRLGYALERAGRLDEARAAYAVAVGDPGAAAGDLDPVAVETARILALRGVRLERERTLLGDLLQRRGRVIPVVTRSRRRLWERAAPHDTAARLHLHYLTHRDVYLPGYFARAETYGLPRNRLARAWRWYVGDVLIQSIKLARANGRFIRRTTGVPVRRQLWESVRLSLTVPAMPESYYKYEWYRPGNRSRAGEYLHGHENSPVIYEVLAEAAGQTAPLTDKVAFAARARALGLAVVPTLAVVEDGAVVTGGEDLPPADVFVKPLAGKGGRDTDKWRYNPESDSFRRPGQAVDVPRAKLLRVLAERSVGQRLLVQRCLLNHPDLADLALAAVVTCRIITITDEHGRAEPVIATFRMPAVPDAIVDNMHRGGIAAPVEIGSGVLGAASDYATAGPASRHRSHPVSGGLIEGRTLPLWDRVLTLVREAHESFAPRLLVGWDVSLGPDGPLLLEGNERPGVSGLQRLHDVPLGTHRFGELLAYHLDRRLTGAAPQPVGHEA